MDEGGCRRKQSRLIMRQYTSICQCDWRRYEKLMGGSLNPEAPNSRMRLSVHNFMWHVIIGLGVVVLRVMRVAVKFILTTLCPVFINYFIYSLTYVSTSSAFISDDFMCHSFHSCLYYDIRMVFKLTLPFRPDFRSWLIDWLIVFLIKPFQCFRPLQSSHRD
jgi:hypothetical protein